MPVLQYKDKDGNWLELVDLQAREYTYLLAPKEQIKIEYDYIDETDNYETVKLPANILIKYNKKDWETLKIELQNNGLSGYSNSWSIIFTAYTTSITFPPNIRWSIAEPVFDIGKIYWLSFISLSDDIYLGVWSVIGEVNSNDTTVI